MGWKMLAAPRFCAPIQTRYIQEPAGTSPTRILEFNTNDGGAGRNFQVPIARLGLKGGHKRDDVLVWERGENGEDFD